MTTLDNVTLERLIAFRRELHQNPEISMKEVETKKRIIGILKEFGVQDEWILPEYPSVKTALVVDIKGQGEPDGKNFCVALRADTDALSMNEESENLPYKSQNPGAAHMCGHDGHVTCLISLVPLLLKNIK
jgi:hippurate hydrolase